MTRDELIAQFKEDFIDVITVDFQYILARKGPLLRKELSESEYQIVVELTKSLIAHFQTWNP